MPVKSTVKSCGRGTKLVIAIHVVNLHDRAWENLFKPSNLTSKHTTFVKKQIVVTNLGAPNGHVSRPKIQMQSLVFSRVLTV